MATLKKKTKPVKKILPTAKKSAKPSKTTSAKKATAPKKKTAAKKPVAKKSTLKEKIKTKTKLAIKSNPAKNKIVSAKKKPAAKKILKPATKKPIAKKSKPEQPVSGRLHELKKMLIAKRDGILSEGKSEISKYMNGENRQLVDTANDEGDWAVVDTSEELSLRRLATHRKLLMEIDECLRKIQEGTYGTCEECGEEISSKRLNVLPTATHCVDCQENREKFEAVDKEPEI